MIAGNGSSLKEIDYRRLPKEYDVFRSNQFFFEDKYYLGKYVTGFFCAEHTVRSLYTTSVILEDKREYFFNNIYFSDPILDESNFSEEFFTIKVASASYLQHPKIARFINNHWIVYGLYPTTGMIMILTAIALGYTDIYVTGIDFYKGENLYAFSIENAKILNNFLHNMPPIFSKHNTHTEDMEYKCIELIKNIEEVNVYAISPSSVLSELLSLAPIKNNTPHILEDKPDNYIKDIILFAEQNNQGKMQKIKRIFEQKNLLREWEFLQKNGFIQFIYQTIKIPYIILKILIKIIK